MSNGTSNSSLLNHLHVDDEHQILQRDAVDSEVGAVDADTEVMEMSSITASVSRVQALVKS